MTSSKWLRCAAFLIAIAVPGTAAAEPVADFYRGKTVSVYIGFGPGGGYDAYGQLLAAHIGRHIPGRPTVIAKHMPGGGSLVLANYLYNVAPADGTAFGIFAAGAAFMPLIGSAQEKASAKYDAAKFKWLGSLENFTVIGIAWHASGFRTIEDIKKKELRFGSPGPASGIEAYSQMLNDMVGTKLTPIRGYRGSADVTFAMEKGEVDGFIGWCWTCMKADKPHYIRDRLVNVFVLLALEPEPELAGVPSAFDLVTDPKDRQAVRLILANLAMSRPFAAPPGLPPERLKTLRDALVATAADPLFLAAAKKAGRDINLFRGEQIETLLKESYSLPDAIVRRAAEVSSAR
jgi:tripartite-type tricarboxylate transporter receptor subunit TctC